MDSDFRAFLEIPDTGAKKIKRRGGYNAFGWTVFLLLLTGGVMASWIASFYVYNHPENPDCYHFLRELNRIESPNRFEITAAPAGKFFSAKELYDAYLVMSPQEIDAKNNELLRDYLRNYADVKTPVPYLWGHFTTTGVYELGKYDMFPSGMVAVADSADFPQVQIEHIYPTAFSNVPRARQMLATDPEINLEKTFSLVTIVHVAKQTDGRILFTVIPLDYGECAYRQGISSTFRLDPPPSLNLEASLPLVKADAMDNAVKMFALYRKNKGLLANGKMLTLPQVAIASPQKADLHAAKDIPPEAYQPYTPPVAATPPPADDSMPGDTAVADAAPVTPPADELPQASPLSPAQTAAEPPPAVSVAASSPVTPITQTASAVVKTSPSLPSPAVTSTAQAVPALPRTTALAKPDKAVAKIASSALPAPAPAVRPIARVQPAQPAPAITAASPVVVKPKVTIFASASQVPAKPAAIQAPQPVVQRAEPYPSPAPVEYAEAVPAETSAPGVKLNPFLAQQQQAQQQPQQFQEQQTTAPARVGTWQTYNPGMMPRGKLINVSEAPQLADLGIGRERIYMNGRFVVTASSDGRAVLRPVDFSGALTGSSVRIVVEYPSGTRVPVEGAQVARGALRPFQIVDVRRGDDGQVDVYAREVTVPMSQSSPYAERNNRYRVVQQSYNSLD